MRKPLLTLIRKPLRGDPVEVAEVRYDEATAAVSLWRDGACVDVAPAGSVHAAIAKASEWSRALERQGFSLSRQR